MPVVRMTNIVIGGNNLNDHQGVATKEEIRKHVNDFNPVALVDYDVVLTKAHADDHNLLYQLYDTDDYENGDTDCPLDVFSTFDEAYEEAIGGDILDEDN